MDSICIHNQVAADYDLQVRQYDSYGHDVLFGMMYELIRPGERLLDIGIGTGLSSRSFARAGLRCFGVDGSPDMLKECQSKTFADGLVRFDISHQPLPYSDSTFDIVIGCGVFHFFANLEPLINDVVRLSTSKSLLGFSVAGIPFSLQQQHPAKDVLHTPTAWGVPIYQHSDRYVQRLLNTCDFNLLKRQKLLIQSGTPDTEDMLFVVYVARHT